MNNDFIALITSTLVPSSYSYFSDKDRLSQTKYTIQQLQKVGFKEIYLFDNSIENIDKTLHEFNDIKCFHVPQFTFNNKGLNEALLILNNMHHLPSAAPIFKISGRYYPNTNFKTPDTELFKRKDFIGLGVDFNKKQAAFTTRAFFVKNKEILQETLVLAVEEMLGYSRSIHGVKSLLHAAYNIFHQRPGSPFQLSVEQAMARILMYRNNYHLLKKIDVDGYLAGSSYLELIQD